MQYVKTRIFKQSTNLPNFSTQNSIKPQTEIHFNFSSILQKHVPESIPHQIEETGLYTNHSKQNRN